MKDPQISKVIEGRFKGETFIIEGDLKAVMGEDCLPTLAFVKGNPTAINALKIDKYTIDDAPFMYGKIGSLGYIIPAKHLSRRSNSLIK